MKRLIGFALLTVLGAFSAWANPLVSNKPRTEEAVAMDLQDAVARKERSIAQLKAEGVPTIDHLPVIATEAESQRRTSEQVVQRAIALLIVAAKADTGDPDLVKHLIDHFDAAPYFTPAEAAFLQATDISDQDRATFSWRYESLNVLFWSVGLVPSLERPDDQCDVGFLIKTMSTLGPDGLRAKAQLRPQSDLLSAADLIYRYDWAVVDAQLKGDKPPAGLDAGVVYERHYALNWLIGQSGPDWDDISTDT